jgi:hypothetical protein
MVFQVNCCVMRDLTPLEEFVFSERANNTVHQGSVKLTIYDQFRMLETLRLHRSDKLHSLCNSSNVLCSTAHHQETVTLVQTNNRTEMLKSQGITDRRILNHSAPQLFEFYCSITKSEETSMGKRSFQECYLAASTVQPSVMDHIGTIFSTPGQWWCSLLFSSNF